jgi:hypothetical protein
MFIVPCLALTALAVVASASPAYAQTPDHFTCYKAPATRDTPRFGGVSGVSLVDAFRSSTADVKRPTFLCAPTNKNGEDPGAPTHPDHLQDYRIRSAVAFTTVMNQRVDDQFGTHFVDVRRPVSLQVPTAKSHSVAPPEPANPAVDHFQCYKVSLAQGSATTIPGVTIQDQFGTLTVDVKRPRRLCAPVNKNGEEPGAESHAGYLMCYQIKQTSVPSFTTVSPLFVTNQLGSLSVDAKKPAELCVPATRVTGPNPTPTSTPAGPCVLPSPIPDTLSLVALAGIDLDTGFSGQSSDLPGVDDGSLAALRLTNCDLDTQSPTCGQCDASGPIRFPGGSKNCVCYDLADRDASSLAVCDPEAPAACGGGESCECFYGPPLPLSAGAISVCVVNRYTAPLTGTANIADSGPLAGQGEAATQIEASVHNGPTVDEPCPVCVGDPTPRDGVRGGTCRGGAKDGLACDVGGTNAFFGAMSFDCPPARSANIGNLAIRFERTTTGTVSLGSGPSCTAPGFTTESCFCDTCATDAAEPCNTNADCPAGVACGGKRCIGGPNNGASCAQASECPSGGCGRPGRATKPNDCDDAACSPDASDPTSPNDGVCAAGPFDSFCSIETFRGCLTDNECNPPDCADCVPGQVCSGDFRECFLDPIVRTGTPGTQRSVIASAFCIPPTSSSAVNAAAGLPGPGGLLQPTLNFRSGAECGDGGLDPGEACDPPANGPCPGRCLPSCQCPACGDGQVNQPGEQCDGGDDAACPGACQPSCQCTAAVCGDGQLGFGEECDGAAPGGQCPAAACLGNCTCGPFCGDGALDAGEECDGAAAGGQCPASACAADCTCQAFCGDGTIDAGEQCDGGATGSCAGTCRSDCTCAPFCGNGSREEGELCDGGDAALCPGACRPDCTCPAIGELSFTARPGADLDTGWTGTSHDFSVQAGAVLAGEIGACDGQTDTVCTFFANVGSHCSGDASRSCTESTQCAVGQSCVINTYGAPLPLSSGGVPVCVVNRFAADATGTYDTATGSSEIVVLLNSLVHLSANVSQPCPICDCGDADPQTCQLGESGTCSDNPLESCIVEGTGPFGPTSNDCPPNPASNVSGSGLVIPFDPLTSGTTSFASNQPCDGAGFQGQSCWCDGQPQPNACLNACDGGGNDGQPCANDGECPGAPAGACKPLCRQIVGEDAGEGECVAGPIDQNCAAAGEVGCSSDAECGPLGPCVTKIRQCFLDPIVRQGTPGTTVGLSGSTFCIPATTSPAVNSTAGLPGPGAIRLPNTIGAVFCGDGIRNRPAEECDGGDDANCPGNCLPSCSCDTVCGNDIREFGEQCDGTDSTACPGLCTAPASPGECTCPALCGDGFVGPGEQCDPGGPGGTPPPSDAACPGACLQGTCQCPPPICGNGMVEAGESCELPDVGCGPLQICAGAPLCTQCVP